MLPNLIVIGAQKCATTALHRYLAEHPEVFMSQEKELRFFSGETWHRGLRWYESHFAGADTPVVGESSPHYTADLAATRTASRMRELVPGTKLIYMVRDPLERIVSAYVHGLAAGEERRPWHAVAQATGDEPIVRSSRYAFQLEQYLRFFPQDRILVVAQEALLNRRRETLGRVFRFLGVEQGFDSPRFDQLRHVSAEKRRIRGPSPPLPRGMAPKVEGRLPRELRRSVKRKVFGVFSAPIERPRFEPAQRAALAEVLAADAARLRELTGEAFPEWSV